MLFNYYQLLGVKPTASNQEIKTAYRSLVKKYHPDKTLGNRQAEEHIKKIIEAYSVLINAEKRKNYDLKLAYAANAKSTSTRPDAAKSKPRANGNNGQYRPKSADATAPKISAWVYVVAALFIVFVTVMFIKYPNGNNSDEELKLMLLQAQLDSLNSLKPTPANTTTPATEADSTNRVISASAGDSTSYYPYFNYFGKGKYDMLTSTTIIVTNNTAYDAVILLLDNKARNRVIRNHYLKHGMVCYMLHVPDGAYFLRAYLGLDWNANKHTSAFVKGGFDNEAGYFQFNRTHDLLTAKQQVQGKNKLTVNYETSLNPLLEDNKARITSTRFWDMLTPAVN